jgi:DNA topoisomerase-1
LKYWKTLSHNGVCLADEYVPDGLSITISGREVKLSPVAEEMAYALAKKKDTPYIQDAVFRANFLKDFLRQLPEEFRGARYEDIDFSALFSKVDREKAAKEGLTKEEKKALAASRKERREALKAKYGKAVVDGKEVDIANWMVEPPGLFMGRGAHPLRGRWKPRVEQSEITLNLDETAPAPPGSWKIVHDRSALWIAKWTDVLTGREKYVWLHESARIQQDRNKAKYDKAEKVGANLERIRAHTSKAMRSPDEKLRQVATVVYLIDHLGMRVGDEKGADEADTVGASTLRAEHIKIDNNVVSFSFLGKDSIPWHKSISPPPEVIKNLNEFMRQKKPGDRVFDDINSRMVNKFLSSIVPGFSAKVFRTYHATATVAATLKSKDVSKESDTDKLQLAKEANLQAAIFCNHQRAPPKTWDQALKNKQAKLAAAKAKLEATAPDKRKAKDVERVKKLEADVNFYIRTKNYNLGTSMKNYIDPRVFKSWCDSVGLDWARVYSNALQKKFAWANKSKRQWENYAPYMQEQPLN